MLRVVSALLVMCSVLNAGDVKPLAEPGKSLFREEFSTSKLADHWKRGPGDYKIADKELLISEKAEDMHAAALRAMIPVQDAVVKFQFHLESAKVMHLGFDPAPGELKDRSGHLFNVVMDGKTLTIQKAGDKMNKEIKPKIIERVPCALEPGWHQLTFSMVGTRVQAIVDEKIVAQGEDEEFKVKKPAVVFRVGGGTARLKNIEVFEVKRK